MNFLKAYQLSDKSLITLVSAYAPTLDSAEEIKSAFYEQLEDILARTPRNHRLVLLGDFNARVGRQAEIWPSVIGKNGIGNCNKNGELLLSKCTEHNLVITNTVFRQKNKHKGTWQHPRSKHWHLIDYVIVKKEQLGEVKITKAITNVENWTDHRLLLSKMSIKLKPRYMPRTKKKTKPRLKLEMINSPEARTSLCNNAELKLASLSDATKAEAESYWIAFRDTLYESSEMALGTTEAQRQPDWFSENYDLIKDILDTKHKACQTLQNSPNNTDAQEKYKSVKQQVQQQIRTIKNSWWTSKAQQIQNHADQHDYRSLFNAIKEVYGVTPRKTCPIKDTNGNPLRTDSEIRNRWKEHYSSILNMDSDVDPNAISVIPQYQANHHMDREITSDEIKEAINALKNNKSPGADSIPAEIYKLLNNTLIEHLRALYNLIWETGNVPQDFKNAQIINLFKNKGSPSECGNYRGISLLSTGGKILARVMASRLLKHMEQVIPESQCGFRPNRGTNDLIFTLRQLQEKVKEQQTQMYIAFVDLTKAFDSINREALWSVMERFGVPPKFLRVCESLHKNNFASVVYNAESTKPFQTRTGVRQGCVLAPILFNTFVTALSMIVDSKLQARGLELRYRFDGGLFNLKRLRAKTRTKFLGDLQYADDCGLVSDTAENLQETLNTYAWAYRSLGLNINIAKTKIMTTPNIAEQPVIHIANENLEYVENFNYLGSIVNTKANIDDEIKNRANSASAAFWKLRKRVFDNHDLSVKTKAAVYRAIVIPTLTYGCETWTPYRRHLKSLNQIQQRHLRQFMHVKWYHKVSNTTILERANCKSIETLVTQSQLRWAGHIQRMPENRIPKCVLYGELAQGQRKQGGQLKRYKDVLSETFKSAHINHNWEELASDRNGWRRVVNSFDTSNIPNRRRNAAHQRGNFECPDCGRIITSRIGLFSHRKTHAQNE